ncbi:MAG TPA: sigma-70 family RNA polymerase sigma factor [Ktedonobacterales bacterium]|nr:sigma-70 family RNA polymerase sigma factor [Ktedonobacterales bacterium]
MEAHQPGELIALARARRAFELGRLPGWGAALTPLAWQRLRAREGGVSSGTLVAILRHAVRQRQMVVTRDVFVVLLARIDAANGFWARQTVRRLPGIAPEAMRMAEEDLAQELALHLWEELALREGEGWELFFRRAMVFARAHVARRYLERHGYRLGQRLVLFFSEIAPSDDDATVGAPPLPEPRDPFTAADLADLRGYVEQLPPRERAAVVMRYWQRAREHEIAAALGVTSRTVRNLLRKAHAQLYEVYMQAQGDAPADRREEANGA